LIGKFAEDGEKRTIAQGIGVPPPERKQGIDLGKRLPVFSLSQIGRSQSPVRFDLDLGLQAGLNSQLSASVRTYADH